LIRISAGYPLIVTQENDSDLSRVGRVSYFLGKLVEKTQNSSEKKYVFVVYHWSAFIGWSVRKKGFESNLFIDSVNKANLVHNFSLYVYFFSLHVSGRLCARHQEK